MFQTMRVRLVLSYAGIALLVTVSLGAVLLVRLRSYYASMEQDYLFSNASAIGSLAAPMLLKPGSASPSCAPSPRPTAAFYPTARIDPQPPQPVGVAADRCVRSGLECRRGPGRWRTGVRGRARLRSMGAAREPMALC